MNEVKRAGCFDVRAARGARAPALHLKPPQHNAEPIQAEDYAAEGLPLPIAQAVETVAYKHDSSGWWLVHAHNPAHRAPGPGGAFDHTSEPEWVFIDSTWTDRLVRRGDTPVHETSANEWHHAHDRPPRFAAPAGADEGGGAEEADGVSWACVAVLL